MRVIRYVIVVAVLLAASRSALRAQAQALDAGQVLAAAREALGGEQKLTAVKTFVATGRTRQIRGNNLVPIEFEINCELPDKFVRKDEIPAQDTDPTTTGFKGDELIQFPAPPAGPDRAGGPGPGGRAGNVPPPNAGRAEGPQQRVATIKQDFVRLTLGIFATSFPSYPLTFKYAAQGEAPEGKADILDVTGPGNFSARLVIQQATHLPVMLMWQVPATNAIVRVPGQPLPDPVPPGAVIVDAPAPPAANASQEDRNQYATTVADLRRQALAQAKPVDYRIYYADFRDVNGLKWPFRIRRSIAGETIEETTFDRIRLNVNIDPRKFEVPK